MPAKRLIPILFLLAAPVSGQWYNVENDEEAVSLPDAPEIQGESGAQAAGSTAGGAAARELAKASLERILADPVGNRGQLTQPLAVLCFKRGVANRSVYKRDITVEDALWLARMIYGENDGSPVEGEAAAMLWSIAQRSYASGHWNSRSLSALTQAYSQPINPKWRREGAGCRNKPEGHYACTESRFRRRERYASMTWADMGERVTGPVVDFVSGNLPNSVPGSWAWLAHREWNGEKGENFEVLDLGGNVFYGRNKGPDMRQWDGSEVTVSPSGTCPE